MWTVLASWVTVAVVISALITIGMGVLSMTPPAYTTAHVCFSFAAAILFVRIAYWLAFEQSSSRFQLILFAFIIFGIIGSLWFASIKWINQREQEFLQPKQPTAEEIVREVIKELAKSHQNELIKEFPEGFVIFGLMKPGEPLIPGFVPNGVRVNWNTGGVRIITQDIVSFDLPDMTIKHGEATINLNQCQATLPRQVGYILRYALIKDWGFQLKVVSDTEPVIIALGFVKEREIH